MKKPAITGLFVLAAFLSLNSKAQNTSFLPGTSYILTGGYPNKVVTADFNGDGYMDLVLPSLGMELIEIELFSGTGNGTIVSGGSINWLPTGSAPHDVCSADFNGDGKMDIASANSGINNVGVWLGTGTGTFGAVTYFPVGSAPRAIIAADFNRDGKMDLVTGNAGSTNLSVLLGTGTGSFGTATAYAGGGIYPGVTAADFNGDGNLDLASLSSNNVSLSLGTGTGTFGAPTYFTAGTFGRDIESADINGDGNMDVVVVYGTGSSSYANVLLGTGTGSFNPYISNYTYGGPNNVAIADFNGNGELDLVVDNTVGSTARVLEGDGTGDFNSINTTTTLMVTPPDYSRGICAADFNGDQKPDVATGTNNDQEVYVFLNSTPCVADQTVSAAPATICAGSSATITVGSSQTGVNYTLRNNANNSLVAGPVAGTGSAINFNTGALTATTTYNVLARKGPVDYALAFDGVDDNVTAFSHTFSEYTIETWVKFTGSPASKNIIAFSDAAGPGGSYSHQIRTNAAGQFEHFTNDGGSQVVTGTTVATTGTWYHIAIVAKNGDFARLYVNGVEEGTAASIATLWTGGDRFYIGSSAAGGSFGNFEGQLDEVRIWNTVRTAPQISGNMNSCIKESAINLSAYFQFQDGPASGILRNKKNNGLNGTLNNMNTTSAWVPGIGACNEGCSSQMTGTVTVTVNPVPTVTASALPLNGIVCAGDSVTLTSGGTATSYAWAGNGNPAEGIAFVPVASGTYTVTGTGANGCTNTATQAITVNPLPIVTASSSPSNGTVCAGDSLTLTGGGAAAYTWAGTGNPADGIAFVPVTSGTYTVTGIDTNGCSNTAIQAITVNSLPTVTASALPSNGTVCAGDSLTLTGGGAAAYTWAGTGNPADGVAFAPAASGTYTVTGTDTNGCSNTATLPITVNQPSSSSFSATACNSYTWYSNVYTTSGSYTHTVSNTVGCDSTITLNLTINNPATASQTISLCAGQSLTVGSNTYTATGVYVDTLTAAAVNGCDSIVTTNLTVNSAIDITTSLSGVTISSNETGANYQWIDCSNSAAISGATSQNYTATANGNYAVIVTVGNCSDTSACVNITDVGIAISTDQNAGFEVFPNPNTGTFTLRTSGQQPGTIIIQNALGEIVYTERITGPAGNPITINLQELSNGIYYLSADNKAHIKIVLQK